VKNHAFSLLKFLIGWPLSLLALFFLFKLIEPQAPEFFSHLDKISYPLLTYGTISFLIYYFLRGYIWKRVITHEGYNISYKDTNFIWAASELKRYIPGNIWSFVGRALHLTEKGMTKKDIAKCTLFEIEFLIIGSAIVSLLSLPFLITDLNFPAYFTQLIYIIFLLGILLFAFHRKLQIKLFFLPNYHPGEMLFLIFLNALLFFFFGLGYFLTFTSFIPIDPNLVFQLSGVAVLSFLVGYLSILTPSGIGVREGALVFALSKIMPAATAGFVALFGRFILIVAEIIFVVISYLWYHTKNKIINRIETWIGDNQQLAVLLCLAIIYTVYFTMLSSLRFENFYTGKFDLGNMSQTVWNTTQGRFFAFTHPDTTEFVSRLSTHADFILVLLAPFYTLWPDPRNLLFIQSAVIASGAIFVYLIAKEILKSKNLALVFGFAYLINPSIQRVNLYDFHAVALATSFLLGAYYFLLKKSYWYFLLFAILAGITKEQVWLIVSLFGFLLFFQHKKRLFGSILFICSVLFSYYLISYAIPQSLGANQHFALEYYADFGTSPLDIIKNILFSPVQTLQTIFQQERIDYLRQLFYPLGYLSLLAPWFLIFAGPDLTINLLSNNAQLHQIYYQYTATISPFLFIAAIHGTLFIKQIIFRFTVSRKFNPNPFIIIYVLSLSLYGAYLYGPLPGAQDANLDMITKPATDKIFITQTLAQIPSTARVATSNNLGAQLSHRQYLYIMPLGVEKADYLVFYLTSSQPAESLKKDQDLVTKFRNDPNYQVIVEKDIFVVFKKIISP
jgi:uncharacterized membrane protein/uncharacterized membrane protein YbhN (UPF0104 family)